MDQMLQNRIQALLGEGMPMSFQEGGEVFDIDDPATMEESSMAISEPVSDPNESLREAVDALMMAEATAEDPFEARKAKQMAEGAVIGAQAPMGDMALELAQAGRGEDTMLAHLTPGEVILPPEMFDDADFEATVESRFNALDLDPERYVVGMGIASLNPITGLEEFGFFKKVGKALKKVAKKIAPVAGPLANFIPGVGPVLAGAIGAATNVAAGKGISGALSGALGGYGAGKALGGIGSLGGASSGSAANFAKSGFLDKIGALRQGIGSLPGQGFFGKVSEFILPGTDKAGLLTNLGKAGSYMLGDPRVPDPYSDAEIDKMLETMNPDVVEELVNKRNSLIELSKPQFSGLFGPDSVADKLFNVDPNKGTGPLSFLNAGAQQDANPSRGLDSGLGGGLGGVLGAGGIAALLGKLAYDEAKTRKGVPLTPLTQEGATGRYNIEAEIARRMGQPAPNPVEFGLLPRGTIPTLSGGRATPRPAPPMQPVEDSAVMTARYGGPVMAFKDGGNVDMAEFKRMDGKIAGPGTEISDDIPAMLSDGEFVMTGRAVRGAGAFDMQKSDGGIVTLTPNGAESREKGTNLMYDMMDLFAEYADKPKEKRSAA